MHHMGRTRSYLGGAGLHLRKLSLTSRPQHGHRPPEFPGKNVTNRVEDSSSIFGTPGSPPFRSSTPPFQPFPSNRRIRLLPTDSRHGHVTGKSHPINTGSLPNPAGNLPWCLGRLRSLPRSWRDAQMPLCPNERSQH